MKNLYIRKMKRERMKMLKWMHKYTTRDWLWIQGQGMINFCNAQDKERKNLDDSSRREEDAQMS